MKNGSDITKRIALLLEQNSLSTTAFAEQIGASRSSISHILSGRNKPSLDILVSIAENFDEIDLHYLVYGEAHPINNKPTHKAASPPSSIQGIADGLSKSNRSQITASNTTGHIKENRKNISQVILLYDDGSFENFIN